MEGFTFNSTRAAKSARHAAAIAMKVVTGGALMRINAALYAWHDPLEGKIVYSRNVHKGIAATRLYDIEGMKEAYAMGLFDGLQEVEAEKRVEAATIRSMADAAIEYASWFKPRKPPPLTNAVKLPPCPMLPAGVHRWQYINRVNVCTGCGFERPGELPIPPRRRHG